MTLSDVKISNNKLLYRAIGIVARCAGVSEQVAKTAVLKSAYREDELTAAHSGANDSEIINVAFRMEYVVPRAILLASGRYVRCTFQSDLLY